MKALEERVKFLESICAEKGIALDGFGGLFAKEPTEDGVSTDGDVEERNAPGVNRLKVRCYSKALL